MEQARNPRLDPPPEDTPADRQQAPVARLRFGTAAQAQSPAGGVALLARAARQAWDAGFPAILLDIADGGMPDERAMDDLRRACPTILIVADEHNGQPGEATPFPWRQPDLRAIVRATAKDSDGLVSRHVNRPVSQAITRWLLLHAPFVRPMHVTVFVGTLALLMVALMIGGGWAGFVAGALLFQACSLLDGVDGELARATWRSSPSGARADTLVDQCVNLGFFAGLAIGIDRHYGDAAETAAEIAVLLILAGVIIMLLLAWFQHNLGNMNFLKSHYRARFSHGIAGRITDALIVVTSRDFIAFACAIVIPVGLGGVIPFFLLGFALLWLLLILCAVRPILRQG